MSQTLSIQKVCQAHATDADAGYLKVRVLHRLLKLGINFFVPEFFFEISEV